MTRSTRDRPRWARLVLVFTLSLHLAAMPAQAATFFVDAANVGPEDGTALNPFNTISEALALTVLGDAVTVAAGIYTEAIVIPPGVAVNGAGRDVTTIDATGLGTSVVRMVGFGRNPRATLRGFTIRGGSGSDLFPDPNDTDPIFNANAIGGGGVLLQGDGLVEDNRIIDNVLAGTRPNFLGAGVYTVEGNPTITNNIISGNVADQVNLGAPYGLTYALGGGIFVGFFSAPVISENVISGNSARATVGDYYSLGFGGGIAVYAGAYPTSRIDWNVIADNEASDYAGGVNVGTTLVGPSESVLTNNIIVGNSADRTDIYYQDSYGGGVYFYYANVQFTNNTVVGNTSDFGAGLMLGDSYPSLANPNIANDIIVTNNIISGNDALGGGGGVYMEQNILTFANNDVFDNTAIEVVSGLPIINNYQPSIQDRTGLQGNVSVDPLYVNGPARDFHVQIGSPVIDAGSNLAAPAFDHEFNHRPVDGDIDSQFITDIGAYEYIPAGGDGDADGIPDSTDNCPSLANASQVDGDGDGVGDICDDCPAGFNPTQGDSDRDGLADACDNCRGYFNTEQADLDNDNIGDICDNCRTKFNPGQEDFDFDKVGDACDNCTVIRNRSQTDTDMDLIGNSCDDDDDNDGVTDLLDCASRDRSASAPPPELASTMQVTEGVGGTLLDWEPLDNVQVYDLYRGDMATLTPAAFNYNHSCRAFGLLQTDFVEPDLPPPGLSYYYLAAGRNACASGTLGSDTGTPAVPRPFFFGGSCPADSGYTLFLSSTGVVSVRFNDDPATRLDSNFLYPNRMTPWFHVGVTYDGAEIRMYIDGILDASLPIVFDIGAQEDVLTIGATPDGKAPFKGLLEEVRVYNRALTPVEMQAVANIQPVASGLAGHWKFDEGVGQIAQDSSPSANTGQMVGSPIWQTGLSGSALKFGGLVDWIVVNDDPSLDITDNISLSVWVNAEIQAFQRILYKVDKGDYDRDGIQDLSDGCPFVADGFQSDFDGDGVGTACDNCPHVANPSQANLDGDVWGDICDEDADNDGILNGSDPSPLVPDGPLRPHEIGRSLAFTSQTTMDWDPLPAAVDYAAYRMTQTLGTPFAYGFDCLQSGLVLPTVVDIATPAAGTMFFYLVTTRDANGESSPGQSSAGLIRPLVASCP